MAQSFWDGLSVSGLDGQTTGLAVQSLLESQIIAEPEEDEDDIFQCGKCKSQFTNLTEFMNHKKRPCTNKSGPTTGTTLSENSVAVSNHDAKIDPTFSTTCEPTVESQQNVFPTNSQSLPLKSQANVIALNQGALSAAALGQMGQGIGTSFLLSDDFLTLTAIDNASNLSISFQGNPILSQVASPLTPKQEQPAHSSSTVPGGYVQTTPGSGIPLGQEHEIATSDTSLADDHNSPQQPPMQPLPGQTALEPVYPAQGGAVEGQAAVVEQYIETSHADQLYTTGLQPLSVVQLPAAGQTQAGQPMVLTQSGVAGSQIQVIALTQPKGKGNEAGFSILNPQTGNAEYVLSGQAQSTSPSQITLNNHDTNSVLTNQIAGEVLANQTQASLSLPGASTFTLQSRLKQTTPQELQFKKTTKESAKDGLVSKGKLKCSYCGKGFNKNFDLQQHVRSHTGEKPFQCIVCGRAFAQKSNVKKHMLTHKVWPKMAKTLPDEPLVVKYNDDAGDQTNASKAVMSKADEVRDVWATITPSDTHGQPDTSKTVLVNVINNPASTEVGVDGEASKQLTASITFDNSYKCQYCGEKVPSYFRLKSHMQQHKNEQVYKCVHASCHETFRELDAFLEHVKSHEHEMDYRCHVCSKTFKSLYDLGMHQYSHNQGSSRASLKSFKCVQCGNRYSTLAALRHHVDTTDHRYPCSICQKVFHSERFLRRHLLTHNSENNYTCEVCNRGFKTEYYLRQHKFVHSSDKPFVCHVCDRSFTRRDKLQRHKIIHDATKKYKCPFKSHTGCEKAFNRADKLKAHIISHSGLKPFKCQYCDKTFSRKPHLVEHIRTHEGNFRFHCELCGKGFNRRNVLRIHMARCNGKPAKQNGGMIRKSTRPIKRKVGRPRKIYTPEELNVMANKVKRKVGRPRKNPQKEVDPEIRPIAIVSLNDATISSNLVDRSVNGEIGQGDNNVEPSVNTAEILKSGTYALSQSTDTPVSNVMSTASLVLGTESITSSVANKATIEEGELVLQAVQAQVLSENTEQDSAIRKDESVPLTSIQDGTESNNSAIVSSTPNVVQITTNQFSDNFDHVGSKSDTVVNTECTFQVNTDASTQENIQTVQQSLQLVQGPDGTAYLVNEATQQILAQISNSNLLKQTVVTEKMDA